MPSTEGYHGYDTVGLVAMMLTGVTPNAKPQDPINTVAAQSDAPLAVVDESNQLVGAIDRRTIMLAMHSRE